MWSILIQIWLMIYVYLCMISCTNSFQSSVRYNPRIKRNSRHTYMAFDTIVEVGSNYESKCSLASDKGISLLNYMQLPVEQYVCIKMPLDATLSRIDGNRFNLTVPPVRFFNLDVSPTLICRVTQTNEAVLIESSECCLRGSPFVESLNGCFRMQIKTIFKWIDTPTRRSILSNSNIYVEVDPPAPFKYFGKNILERTGSLAMSIALRQIENAFVSSLSRDYERWATDKQYRLQRAGRFSPKTTKETLVETTVVSKSSTVSVTATSETDSVTNVALDIKSTAVNEIDPTVMTYDPSIGFDAYKASKEDEDFLKSISNDFIPDELTDDMCLLPGEPIIRIEEAPSNSRRIFSGIDIIADINDVWGVLTNYRNLQSVVPSLVRNDVLFGYPDGGARLSQVGK